jgi:hypothetical protein
MAKTSAKKSAKKPVRTAKKATKRPVTKRIKPAKEPATLRAMLDMIDRFLAVEYSYNSGSAAKYDNAGQLWTVLTALRGPDNGDTALKSQTTARIRSKAFPRCAARYESAAHQRASFYRGEPTEIVVDLANNGHFDSHFVSHAESAAKVLGLKVSNG